MERFAREYIVDLDAGAAALRAGYQCNTTATATQKGCHLLKRPDVGKLVAELKARQADRLDLKADDVLRELLRLARVDIGEAFDDDGKLKAIKDIPVDVRRAIAGVEVDELFEGHGEDREQVGFTRKVKFWDKTKALELLGKHLKLFVERHEHTFTDRAAALARARARVQAAGSTTAPAPAVAAP
jgi:phage terminase small subunit